MLSATTSPSYSAMPARDVDVSTASSISADLRCSDGTNRRQRLRRRRLNGQLPLVLTEGHDPYDRGARAKILRQCARPLDGADAARAAPVVQALQHLIVQVADKSVQIDVE